MAVSMEMERKVAAVEGTRDQVQLYRSGTPERVSPRSPTRRSDPVCRRLQCSSDVKWRCAAGSGARDGPHFVASPAEVQPCGGRWVPRLLIRSATSASFVSLYL